MHERSAGLRRARSSPFLGPSSEFPPPPMSARERGTALVRPCVGADPCQGTGLSPTRGAPLRSARPGRDGHRDGTGPGTGVPSFPIPRAELFPRVRCYTGYPVHRPRTLDLDFTIIEPEFHDSAPAVTGSLPAEFVPRTRPGQFFVGPVLAAAGRWVAARTVRPPAPRRPTGSLAAATVRFEGCHDHRRAATPEDTIRSTRPRHTEVLFMLIPPHIRRTEAADSA